MGLCAKERRGKNLVLTCASKKRDGVKSFPKSEVLSFLIVCSWTRINAGLVPFYIRDIWIAASHAQSRAPELAICVEFWPEWEDLPSQEYISLTQKYCHSYNNTILDIQLGPTGTQTQLVKDLRKILQKYAIIVHRVPVCLGFCGTLLCKVALLLLFIINFTVQESSSS